MVCQPFKHKPEEKVKVSENEDVVTVFTRNGTRMFHKQTFMDCMLWASSAVLEVPEDIFKVCDCDVEVCRCQETQKCILTWGCTIEKLVRNISDISDTLKVYMTSKKVRENVLTSLEISKAVGYNIIVDIGILV